MTDTKYNGWTNYETWNCALWMDNSGERSYWEEVAQECYKSANARGMFTREEQASFDLSDHMKDHFEEALSQWMPDQASFFADMLNASISAVNWPEIARHYVDAEVDHADKGE